MPLHKEHDLHRRRKGRNLGVGLLLGGFVVLVMALTVVKVGAPDFKFPTNTQDTSGGE